jgi:predicted Zn-dependent protease
MPNPENIKKMKEMLKSGDIESVMEMLDMYDDDGKKEAGDAMYKESMEYMKDGKYDDADKALTIVIKMQPNNYMAKGAKKNLKAMGEKKKAKKDAEEKAYMELAKKQKG